MVGLWQLETENKLQEQKLKKVTSELKISKTENHELSFNNIGLKKELKSEATKQEKEAANPKHKVKELQEFKKEKHL